MGKPLFRTLPKRQPKSFAVLDIETEGLGGPFVLAGIAWRDDHGLHFDTYDSVEKVLHILTSKAGRAMDWYAHNGMGYDYKYFIQHRDYLLKRQWAFQLVTSGSQDIGIKLTHRKHGAIHLKDFFRIAPFSLDKLSRQFNVEHKKLNHAIDFEKESFTPSNPEHMRYLQHDCFGFLEVIEAFTALWRDTFATPLGWTTPSSALRAWRATIPEGHVYWTLPQTVRDFIRLGYYGGMVRVDRTEWQARDGEYIGSWDMNSMYPAMMLEGVPIGSATHSYTYRPSKPGFWKIAADVPHDAHFTILPLRDKTGTKFPTGQFETVATNLEIDKARELGHHVTVLEGYYFQQIEYPFAEFIAKCQSIRYNPSFKGTPLELVAKLAQNALYGKFGCQEDVEHLTITDDPESDLVPFVDPQSGQMIEALYTKSEKLETDYLHVEWAAWITAKARLKLCEVAEPASREDRLVYTDTDSVKLVLSGPQDAAHIPTDPKEYGKWKHEADIWQWANAGPKTYAYREFLKGPEQPDSFTWLRGWTVHAKGVPTKHVRPEQIIAAAQGQPVSIIFRSMRTLGYQVKHGTPDIVVEQAHRTLTTPAKVLGWELEGDRFRPVHIDPITQLVFAEEAEQHRQERAEARMLAAQMTDLRRRILAEGGIQPHHEYPSLPRSVRRKAGYGLDVIADILGYEDADHLYRVLIGWDAPKFEEEFFQSVHL